jgi:hypothetical protein
MNIFSQEFYNKSSNAGLIKTRTGIPTADTAFLGQIGVARNSTGSTLTSQVAASAPTQDEARTREWKDLRFLARMAAGQAAGVWGDFRALLANLLKKFTLLSRSDVEDIFMREVVAARKLLDIQHLAYMCFRFGYDECVWWLKLLGVYEPETRLVLRRINDYHVKGDSSIYDLIPNVVSLPCPGSEFDFTDDDHYLLI